MRPLKAGWRAWLAARVAGTEYGAPGQAYEYMTQGEQKQ